MQGGRADRREACPSCGAPVRALTTVQEVEGDLVELGARRSGQRDFPEWERRRFFAELSAWPKSADMRRAGRPPVQKKFGHWPNGYDRVAMEPSVSTRNWVRPRQIAYAKSGGRAAHG